ncbi:MAG: M23 family metallopeptidase [Candidatus Komeilibacteria bacterium]|nr:M23 family metallopeptidase [Candidatus Komeilibacteria bacterium]
MFRSYKVGIFFILALIISAISVYSLNRTKADITEAGLTEVASAVTPTERVQSVLIGSGDTYGKLMTDNGLTPSAAASIYEAAKPTYDLAKIKAGKVIKLIYDISTDELRQIIYDIDSEERLTLTYQADKWLAEKTSIPYETKIVTVGGEIVSSMYAAALKNNIDERAIIELANAFQWSIDFAMDPRVGDTFRFVYEERYLDGEYVMPGRVLAGQYVNAGSESYVYFYDGDAEAGFYDEDGNSVQKMFLKAPVEYKYISSGFTTGQRYVKAFNVSTGHRAIDYAAAHGTPIRAVGDGTVTFAGWSSAGYGNLTSIRHNGTYSTNYAHQSRFAVRKGDKVKQGQIIGYVGSTGFSTGPHVHYELVKNGVKVNPLLEILPPGEPIASDKKGDFSRRRDELKSLLNE